MGERIGVIGLGYVGLPVALGFAAHYPQTIGFDISTQRVDTLRSGHDVTGEVTPEALKASALKYTTDPRDLMGTTFFVVTVPTPIDDNRQPDLRPVLSACETVGRVLSPGAVVVFESTVYPGVTEEICGPLLARISGLRQGVDFKLGYSPERINPGDKEHTLTRIVKVVSGEDEATLERVAEAYGRIVEAGVHRAPTIKVAEAAKVIENTQRDLNIALMNELALIFDRLGIRTRDVLAAASTKWNFLPFTPGLVGGHCIGVDPYYLTTKAKAVGYYPQVILAGRRINDGMGAYVAQRLVKLLIEQDRPVKQGRVGILGLTFKENVPDLRNSRVPDIIKELRQFGIEPLIHDPLADGHEAQHEYGLTLSPLESFQNMDGLILAVPHRAYLAESDSLARRLAPNGVLMDVKSALSPSTVGATQAYWSL
ncbi:UDP-N-acetyl-D-galactosamine dehydrogenase [Ectothiorhodospira magna]|uniref:UDP-N-acetyl-D-galactosamine dehydrogenase n=1 Tax=Ectothiorhodospira magna TaxID=867345 RepID=A0A1H9E5A4_9GAMM|nr:nucleotide sugar dehydrogenase [Ectothiorhodospira magna]SEQ20916.1 UDP-N-acetyl-D-galactosamine dehydrogenase [Ectothiorhodospira magna]